MIFNAESAFDIVINADNGNSSSIDNGSVDDVDDVCCCCCSTRFGDGTNNTFRMLFPAADANQSRSTRLLCKCFGIFINIIWNDGRTVPRPPGGGGGGGGCKNDPVVAVVRFPDGNTTFDADGCGGNPRSDFRGGPPA